MEFELRDWKLADAENIVHYANNPNVAENLRDAFPHPYTLDDAHTFISQSNHRNKTIQSIKAIVVDGVAIGSIGLIVQGDVSCKSGELGFWLGEPFWGKDIMTKAIIQACDNGFENFDMNRIYARPFAENMGARKALENAGFELEGIFKKSIYKNENILDSCMYALVK